MSWLVIFCVLCWTGFSDPYCILTILIDEEESRTRQSRAKDSKSVVKDAVSDDKIYQTDIKKQTLNPIWNQTFILWVHVCVFMSGEPGWSHFFLQFLLFALESLKTLLVPVSTSRCGEENIQSSTSFALKSSFLLHSHKHLCFRDKDEEVSLTQKLEEIKTNFNSLRRYYTLYVTQTQTSTKGSQTQKVNLSILVLV